MSLWNELVFNDGRDAERRGNKREEATAIQIHAVCTKSIAKRASMEKQLPISLSPADWSLELPGKSFRASVFQPGRMSDKTLGIDTQQLTRSKAVPTLTKPHIFMQRLNLMQHLVPKFHAAKAAHLDFDVTSEISKMWTNQLMMPDFFITWNGRSDQHVQLLVLGSGPYSTLCYKLHSRDEFWVPSQKDFGVNHFLETSLQSFDTVSVAAAETSLLQDGSCKTLAWKKTSDWMSLEDFVCEYHLLTITCSLLNMVCRQLKIKGYTRVCHKERCRMLLEHCMYDQARIEEIMCLLPDRPPRRRRNQAQTSCLLQYMLKTNSYLDSFISFP